MNGSDGIGGLQSSLGGLSTFSTVSSIGWRTAQRVLEKNRGLAAIIRKERDERLHRHLLKEPMPQDGSEPPPPRAADEEEVQKVAQLLNERMNEIILDPTARSWYKLFTHMDDDFSGKICFHELEDMIRKELRLSKKSLSDEQLRAIWRALDADKSGLITCGEFGHFMRRGLAGRQDVQETGPERLFKDRVRAVQGAKQVAQCLLAERNAETASRDVALRERVASQKELIRQVAAKSAKTVNDRNGALAAVVRKERDEMFHKHLKKAPGGGNAARIANQAEVEQVAALLNQRMKEIILDPTARSWFKLFNHMDDDGSGKINYVELEDMIRNELKLSPKRLTNEQLQALWRALDEDNSGLISCGEFGHFMKQGLQQESPERGRERLHKERRREAEKIRQERQRLREERHGTLNALLTARYQSAGTWRQYAWGDATLDLDHAPPWRAPRAAVL